MWSACLGLNSGDSERTGWPYELVRIGEESGTLVGRVPEGLGLARSREWRPLEVAADTPEIPEVLRDKEGVTSPDVSLTVRGGFRPPRTDVFALEE